MEVKYDDWQEGFVILLHDKGPGYDAYDIVDHTRDAYVNANSKYCWNDFTSLPTWIGTVL